MPTLRYIIGIDEVGRGPLAGPVTICAFAILETDLKLLDGIGAKDSKVLSEQKRDVVAAKLAELKKAGRCVYQVASISSSIVDEKGLTKSIFMAIEMALKKLNIHPEHADVYLDGGLRAPKSFFRQHTIIHGDGKVPVISCASCIAKVHRDGLMNSYDLKFPEYGFYAHKGYGTPDHYKMIRKFGLCGIHRKSFLKDVRGVKEK
ncbi:MAG: rnhB [Patescibacteria group bacterium]|nr:rnhB [Patescibacteria group bacterium]